MNGLIDLVLVEHPGSNKRYLFKAPPYQVFAGDEVICRTAYGEVSGKVIETVACFEGNAEYRFAVAASGASEPLKEVIYKIERIPVVYRELPRQRTNRDMVIECLQGEGMNVDANSPDSLLLGGYCHNNVCTNCPVDKSKTAKDHICSVATFTAWANQPEETTDDLPF